MGGSGGRDGMVWYGVSLRRSKYEGAVSEGIHFTGLLAGGL